MAYHPENFAGNVRVDLHQAHSVHYLSAVIDRMLMFEMLAMELRRSYLTSVASLTYCCLYQPTPERTHEDDQDKIWDIVWELTGSLNQLLVILRSPSISEFDPITVIRLWNSGSLHTRRSNTGRIQIEKQVQESDEGRIQEMDVGTTSIIDTDAY
ncbi:uncharacterized protein LOC111088744 [Limulus polyphemus]|uniref:Uncharacterized protein LOC111088744 n=1 Tax=Limulus polyphemus TaxID=6850 RepID=A0ABM1THH7_LIMPO|nr:uncharacterized protein LOC111088744 [Limulus polyphemus]